MKNKTRNVIIIIFYKTLATPSVIYVSKTWVKTEIDYYKIHAREIQKRLRQTAGLGRLVARSISFQASSNPGSGMGVCLRFFSMYTQVSQLLEGSVIDYYPANQQPLLDFGFLYMEFQKVL